MRVIFDVTSTLLAGVGIRTHIHLWAAALQRSAGSNTLSLFPYLNDLGPLEPGKSPCGPVATTLRVAFVRALNRSSPLIGRLAVGRGDIFHASQHMHYPPSKMKLTATLFDMSCWTAPETHLPANIVATREYADRILLRCDGIMANSNSAREDAARILRLSAEKIEVISPGVRREFFETGPDKVETARQKYQLDGPYLLWVGAVEPRKNLDILLDAYAALSPEIRKEWPLIIVGPAGWAPASTLARLRSAENGLRYLGYVPERDLPAITAGASIFVFPSLYEGFGLPLAQAMACGVASITSNVSSLPEVAGDAAVFVDPRNAPEITEAIRRLILTPSERDRLAHRGRSRAAMYSWENTAQKTWRFFERVAG